jgi:hypothetical protein
VPVGLYAMTSFQPSSQLVAMAPVGLLMMTGERSWAEKDARNFEDTVGFYDVPVSLSAMTSFQPASQLVAMAPVGLLMMTGVLSWAAECWNL